MPVYLHGIRRDNFPLKFLCQLQGQGRLSHGGGACQNDKRFFFLPFFHIDSLLRVNLNNPFEFSFQFIFAHGNNRRPAVRAMVGILQLQQLFKQRSHFLP